MIDELIFILTLLSALGCGLMAGFFFAFSTCVMKALSRLPAAQSITVMQIINVVVLNRLFFTVFFGTAAACVVLGISSLFISHQPDTIYRVIASATYLLGTILVTIACNVPRNDALATVQAYSADAEKRWKQFLPGWIAWNHVRTLASFLAATLFTIALCVAAS